MVRDLRVTLNVQRTLESQPSAATIVVSNLSERTRAELQEKPLRVQVDVGYDDDEATLFVGDVVHTSSRRVGTDWETTLQLGDGARAHRHARVTRSFRGGVTKRDAIREVARAMGLSLPRSVDEAGDLLEKLDGGLSLSGLAEAQMTKLLGLSGRTWSIQSGQLQILGPTEVRNDEAVLITADTGMIGSPESGAPKNPGEPSVVKVSVTMDPRLVPGGRVKVESRRVSGLFKIERVTHVGDTHGPNWTSTVEGVAS